MLHRVDDRHQQLFTRNAGLPFERERRRQKLELLRKPGLVYVNANSRDHRLALQLRQNPGTLPGIQQNVVRPAQVRRQAGNFGDCVPNPNSECEHHYRQRPPARAEPENHRDIQPALSLRMPDAAVTSDARHLFIGADDRS